MRVRNRVSLVLPYYDNAGMLAQQYDDLRQLPVELRQAITLVIVDDGSPRAPAQLPADDLGLNVLLFRILVDVRWNQDAARNIGVRHSPTPWLLLTDIDHRVPEVTWRQVLCQKFDASCAYRFSRVSAPLLDPYKPHPNSWLMTAALYERAGGYDERFAGWYGTDADFRDRVRASASDIVLLKEPLIRVPREVIPDASTTSYARKTEDDGANIRRIKQERGDAAPLRFQFPYHRVF